MIGVQIFNALEAVFWLVLAGLAATKARRVRGFTPRRQLAMAVFLAAFGISDIWEIFSGGWWRPPALFVLKAVCFTGLAITAAFIYAERWSRLTRSRRRRAMLQTPSPSAPG
jgi:hypothetical protein